ncbi:MAG TPA: hypothetical protein VGD91_04985 [Trebonia sp.]
MTGSVTRRATAARSSAFEPKWYPTASRIRVRYRPASFLTRRVPMPVGEPGGRATPRLEQVVRAFRTAGINAKAEPQMNAWLKTHAAFAVPPGLAAMPTPAVPGGFAALRTLPEGLLAAMLRRFLRSPTAAHSGLSNARLPQRQPNSSRRPDRCAPMRGSGS